MDRFTFVLALSLLVLGQVASPGGEMRVVTWEVDGLRQSSGVAVGGTTGLTRLHHAAANLQALQPDVIILRGVPDSRTAERLRELLKPTVYRLALQTDFGRGSAAVGTPPPPITILSRATPFVAQALDWRTTRQIDADGGLAYVGFRFGTNVVGVYAVQLPGADSRAINGSRVSARARQVGARYVVHHINWLAQNLSTPFTSVFIAGDFVATDSGSRADDPLPFLRQAGFSSSVPGLSLQTVAQGQGTENPSQPRSLPPQGLLTALLGAKEELGAAPRVYLRPMFSRPIVTYDIRPGGAVGGTVGLSADVVRVRWWENQLVLMPMAGVVFLALITFGIGWMIRRTSPPADLFGSRVGTGFFPAMDGSHREPESGSFSWPGWSREGRGERLAGGVGRTTVHVSETPEERRSQPQAAAAGERAVSPAPPGPRTSLLPHLRSLLRDRVVSWLSAQRRELITSQEAGTQQVLDLEERLLAVQEQLQGRLEGRDRRIAELELEILAKEKTIRDLLRAQVRLVNRTPEA